MDLLHWPGGAKAAVSLTFDVDGESGWLGSSPAYAARLSSLSDGSYGVNRGLERICSLLQSHGVGATFYVPGFTAEHHEGSIQALAAAGHEIAHHGYLHRPTHLLDEAEQREEIARGIAALEKCLGQRPWGYRSPCWELTPFTFGLLNEYEFAWDSSLMGDDRPYTATCGDESLLELPVHWFLDDWPHFSWSNESGGQFADRSAVAEAWLDEVDNARAEGRSVTYTMHPEVTGRADHLVVLERLLSGIQERGDVWVATHGEVASWVRERSQ